MTPKQKAAAARLMASLFEWASYASLLASACYFGIAKTDRPNNTESVRGIYACLAIAGVFFCLTRWLRTPYFEFEPAEETPPSL